MILNLNYKLPVVPPYQILEHYLSDMNWVWKKMTTLQNTYQVIHNKNPLPLKHLFRAILTLWGGSPSICNLEKMWKVFSPAARFWLFLPRTGLPFFSFMPADIPLCPVTLLDARWHVSVPTDTSLCPLSRLCANWHASVPTDTALCPLSPLYAHCHLFI